jgi:hypothetical protein
MRSWNCPWMSPQIVTGALTFVTFLHDCQKVLSHISSVKETYPSSSRISLAL